MKKVLISACLLGENVKYNGSNNDIRSHPFIQHLVNLNLLVPLCPETLAGLPTPRVPVEIVDGRAISKEAVDLTKEFYLGARIVCDVAHQKNVKMAILKSRSPSCGVGLIYDGSFTKRLTEGNGICAQLLEERKITIFCEDELKMAEKFWNKLQN